MKSNPKVTLLEAAIDALNCLTLCGEPSHDDTIKNLTIAIRQEEIRRRAEEKRIKDAVKLARVG